jgi:hypothetical protein
MYRRNVGVQLKGMGHETDFKNSAKLDRYVAGFT